MSNDSAKSALIYVTLLLAFILFIYFMNRRDRNKAVEVEKRLSFSGVVDTIFLKESARMQPFVRFKSGKEVYIGNDIYERIKKGDFLFKNEGNLTIFLVQNHDTIAFYQ